MIRNIALTNGLVDWNSAGKKAEKPETAPVSFGSGSWMSGKAGKAMRNMALATMLISAPVTWATVASAQAEQTQPAAAAEALTPANFAEKTKGLPSFVVLHRGAYDNASLTNGLAAHPALKGKMSVFTYNMDQANANSVVINNAGGENIGLPPAQMNECALIMSSQGVVVQVLGCTSGEGEKFPIDDVDGLAKGLAEIAPILQ